MLSVEKGRTEESCWSKKKAEEEMREQEPKEDSVNVKQELDAVKVAAVCRGRDGGQFPKQRALDRPVRIVRTDVTRIENILEPITRQVSQKKEKKKLRKNKVTY